MKKNTLVVWAALATTLFLALFCYRQSSQIKAADACLCTELLASASLTQNKAKIKAVRDCEMLFEDFEKAHVKCMETVPFEHPTIEKDTLKST